MPEARLAKARRIYAPSTEHIIGDSSGAIRQLYVLYDPDVDRGRELAYSQLHQKVKQCEGIRLIRPRRVGFTSGSFCGYFNDGVRWVESMTPNPEFGRRSGRVDVLIDK